MSEITNRDIEWLLNLDKNSSGKFELQKPIKNRWKKMFAFAVLGIVALLFLGIFPFILSVRTSLYLINSLNFAAWPAIAGGVFASVILLFIYVLALFRKVKNTRYFYRISLILITVAVLGFSFHSLMFLSGSNAKTEEVKNLYRSMHPVLRMAVATVTLANSELVITDIERTPEDYSRMGLTLNPNSLHYRQETGYVHAVDLRTIGLGYVRNAWLEISFRVLGFRTLRHTGTADHLHVQLQPMPNT